MTRLTHFIRISDFDEANEGIETAVQRWSQRVSDLTIAEISKATYLSQLFRALRIVEPGKDWRWLDEDARRWKRASKASPDRKRKHMRYTPTAMLRELSRQLIDDAEMSRPSAAAAVRYRDGLVIGLLARRPIRLRNLANLRLNESLRLLDGEWWITLQEGETKNGDGLSFRIDDLSYEIERWLQNWRPYLTPTDPQHLWPSHISGLPLTSGALSRHIGDVTEKYLGKRLTPHFFRDALMTDLASTGEEFAVRAGSHVLGHRSAASADAYIVRAISEKATSKLDMIIGLR